MPQLHDLKASVQRYRKVVLEGSKHFARASLQGASDLGKLLARPALVLNASHSIPGFVLGSALCSPQVEVWLLSSVNQILTVPSEYVFLDRLFFFFLFVTLSSSPSPSSLSERNPKILLTLIDGGGGHLCLLLLLWETFHRAEFRKLSFQTYHSV